MRFQSGINLAGACPQEAAAAFDLFVSHKFHVRELLDGGGQLSPAFLEHFKIGRIETQFGVFCVLGHVEQRAGIGQGDAGRAANLQLADASRDSQGQLN